MASVGGGGDGEGGMDDDSAMAVREGAKGDGKVEAGGVAEVKRAQAAEPGRRRMKWRRGRILDEKRRRERRVGRRSRRC